MMRHHQITESPDHHLTRRRRTAGFTLIEASLAIVIVGTGVLAILAAQQAYHRKNDWAQRSSTGMLLANELRELTLSMPMHDPVTSDQVMGAEVNESTVADFDDLDDFAGDVSVGGYGEGLTFDPPINALRQQINDLPGWSQTIEVVNVFPDNINVTSDLAQPLGTTDMMRVTVSARYQGPRMDAPMTVAQLTWVVNR